MEKFQSKTAYCYEWSQQPVPGSTGNYLEKRGGERCDKKESHGAKRSPEGREERKETPEEMIRSLQGVFCKGRYRSWTFAPKGR